MKVIHTAQRVPARLTFPKPIALNSASTGPPPESRVFHANTRIR